MIVKCCLKYVYIIDKYNRIGLDAFASIPIPKDSFSLLLFYSTFSSTFESTESFLIMSFKNSSTKSSLILFVLEYAWI